MHLDTAMKNTSSEYSDVKFILQFNSWQSWIIFFLAFVLPSDEKLDVSPLRQP